ncbi:Mitochondrial distribution and morphology protein 31, mitochondrial precursor [Vanrija albida]|uniref:Mitochondrial distribution and morphology protein 31, mitochondrial n=1 Tax=Vanrija albida TaxID=181172 RepID=A0ABR3PSB5_9TREE
MPPAPRAPPGHVQDYIPFIRNLIHRSDTLQQKAHHRPTKEDLLAATSHWWQRFWIRVKWFTIRGWRRFNTDDLSAFFSWFLVGNTLWILLGTTTFISAVFATLNSLSMQEYVARWISDYLTSQAGVTVIFESAIVPRWGASTISFKNVYVSRRPQDTDAETTKTATAKPPAAIAFPSSSVPVDTYVDQPPAAPADNFTMFDINFDEIEVTLDLRRWLDGKGLVKDAKCKGVRGVIDRRCVWWDTTKKLEPADFRHATHPGDFELESFQVEDFLVTVYQPGGQRPYNVSIFNARFGPFRKRWLFYDMLSAEAMTGQYDNCLFSLHMPQKLGRTKVPDVNDAVKRMARFRIDGLPIEHAQYASGNEGPMSWILSGKLDAVLDIKFPSHPDDDAMDVKALIDQIGKNVTAIAMSGQYPDDATGDDEVHERAAAHIADTIAAAEASSPSSLLPGQHRLSQPALRAPEPSRTQEDRRQLTIDIDLRFRDLKAAVPVFTSDLSVTNNALIRPIVAFINANRTLMPIHAQVHADLTDFDGSWTLFETGLMSSISEQIYAALAYHVSSEAANSKRLKQVSFWGIQRGAEVLLDTLKVVVDPLQTQAAMAAA